MFASKLRGNLRSVGYFVQHGYGVSTAPSSQLNVTGKLISTQASPHSIPGVRYQSNWSGNHATTVRDAYKAIESIFDRINKTRTFQAIDLISQCALIQRHVTELRSPYKVRTILHACALITEGNTNVTKLAVSALHQLASLPVDVWQDYKNQEHLRWVLHWAAKCRCTSPVFTKLLQQHLDVLCLDQCRDVDHCAHALFILNSPDRCLARNLMNRYVTIQSTGDPKYRHTQVLSLLLYCTLCGVECSALLKLISVDQLIQKCGVTQLQLLLLHNTLPVTADQRQQIMDKCSLWFQEDTKSQHSGRMYDMLSYFIGPKYTTGISLVDGVSVQALCIFNQDHEPVETDAYPADVYNGVSVDMTAATRHGFSVVACLGVKDTRLLRHPDHVPNGFVVLEASALKWQGCYCIPMILEHGAAKTQKSSRFVPDLMINYPDHIPVFKHLLAPKQ
ncbi:uncharacterized protein LOC135823426 isoform X1 [Sycon ciliatum]|uniref:uncharacterized protein LOC135823426 isoform X1 n=1 Tax=Sycon ciliatum TaxID=27933 RepID=UPI0031F64A0E